MKKILVWLFLFLVMAVPVSAKNSSQGSQQSGQPNVSVKNYDGAAVVMTGTEVTITPIKNKNQVEIQNQGEEQQLSVQTQEDEQISRNIDENFRQVSNQVQQLVETVGGRSDVGQEIKDMIQSQVKLQESIKVNISQLAFRSALSKFFIGSDKGIIREIEQQREQNRLMIQQLEELKLQVVNSGDLDQIQQTINLLNYQNTSLEEKIETENKVNGLFGWLVNLFNR